MNTKTSNKLLLGLFAVILITATVFIGYAKHYSNKSFIAASGDIVTEQRPVESFSRIVVKGNIKVILTTRSQAALELKGDKNLLKNIQTTVKDGELLIQLPFKTESDQIIEAKVSTVSIEALDFSTGSSIVSTDSIVSKKLNLSFTTGASGKLNIESGETQLDCSTGAETELKGSTGTFQLAASTGSIVKAGNFSAHNGSIEGNTGSEISTNISDEIEVSMSTGATAKNKGNPREKRMDLSTGGTFSKK